MPEPTPGRPDSRYLYEIAVNLYSYALTVPVALTLPAPDPSEPQNVLLHKIAGAIYQVFGGTPPPAPCTDNLYLQNIAHNLTAIAPAIVAQGRPDQVLAYIIASQLYAYGSAHAFPLVLAAPNQGDPINRLYYKIASLTFEL
jgi:hypothetical protein